MDLAELSDKRKTKTTAFSLPPKIIEKLNQLAGTEQYGSKSSIVVQALVSYFSRLEDEDQLSEDDIRRVVTLYLSSPSGEAIIRDVIRKMLSTNVGDIEETEIVFE